MIVVILIIEPLKDRAFGKQTELHEPFDNTGTYWTSDLAVDGQPSKLNGATKVGSRLEELVHVSI